MADLSLRAFAKRLKVSDMAVRKAIASGRLKKSVGKNGKGQPVITNAALAIKEWAANAAKPGKGTVSLAEAQRRVAVERERGMKIANDIKEGRLIPAEQATRAGFTAARVIRDNVLNIPARVSAELAAESDAAKVFTRLDTELRLALSTMAAEIAAPPR